MRQKFGHLLTGMLFATWCAALSGMALPAAPQPLHEHPAYSGETCCMGSDVTLARHPGQR